MSLSYIQPVPYSWTSKLFPAFCYYKPSSVVLFFFFVIIFLNTVSKTLWVSLSVYKVLVGKVHALEFFIFPKAPSKVSLLAPPCCC